MRSNENQEWLLMVVVLQGIEVAVSAYRDLGRRQDQDLQSSLLGPKAVMVAEAGMPAEVAPATRA